jgi:hypothetical protein
MPRYAGKLTPIVRVVASDRVHDRPLSGYYRGPPLGNSANLVTASLRTHQASVG